MKIKEELDVVELAEIVNKSPQSIYERLRKRNNIIWNFVVPDSSPTRFYKTVIFELYGLSLEDIENKENSSTLTSKTQVVEYEYLKYKIDLLEKTLTEQKKDLEAKNNMINDLTKLLDQQQQLTLLDRQKITELENRTLLLEESKQKKSIFKKLFTW